MLFNPLDQWIGESLLHYGEYSPAETAQILSILKPGDVAVDVGANIGCLTIPMARKAGTVIALEPQRLMHQLLCANIALNGLKNVYTRQQGAGARQEVVMLKNNGLNTGGASIIEGASDGELIQVITLDALNLDRCDFIKIDVEGFEGAVIEGARETIKRHRPVLHMEADREPHTPALIELVKSLGYAPYWDITPLCAPNNWDGNNENLWPKIVNINMLCVHRDKPMPEGLPSLPPAEDGDTFSTFKQRHLAA